MDEKWGVTPAKFFFTADDEEEAFDLAGDLDLVGSQDGPWVAVKLHPATVVSKDAFHGYNSREADEAGRSFFIMTGLHHDNAPVLFWKEGGHGYTKDLGQAGKFTFKEYMATVPSERRSTDRLVLISEVLKHTRRVLWGSDLKRIPNEEVPNNG